MGTNIGLLGGSGHRSGLRAGAAAHGPRNGRVRRSPEVAVLNRLMSAAAIPRWRRDNDGAQSFVCASRLRCSSPFPSLLNDSRSVLAVKGPLRRFAPWTAPGRSEGDGCSRGKGGDCGRCANSLSRRPASGSGLRHVYRFPSPGPGLCRRKARTRALRSPAASVTRPCFCRPLIAKWLRISSFICDEPPRFWVSIFKMMKHRLPCFPDSLNLPGRRAGSRCPGERRTAALRGSVRRRQRCPDAEGR